MSWMIILIMVMSMVISSLIGHLLWGGQARNNSGGVAGLVFAVLMFGTIGWLQISAWIGGLFAAATGAWLLLCFRAVCDRRGW